MTLEYLLELVHNYSTEDKELIIRAYEFAKVCHQGVLRKSGEPYIIHPLSVACILAEMHADADTIAAGLLHDVLEDCPQITREDLAHTFNPTIAKLVDGVTKFKKIEYNNDKALTVAANNQKLVQGLLQDIRVIIIKLADNLHNMRTEQFQPAHKQEEHARETMGLYVPFARLTGAYKLMVELEDLSFSYLNPQGYKEMDDLIKFVASEYETEKEQILIEVAQMLNSNKIPFNIKSQIKSHYELHRKLLTYGS
ncbi:MAG: HD domain-containing protein [Bacilli bacterium]|nr:HD domain-containing protein [Bacilli bacterium]